jgi:hypothetical protein
MKNSTTISLAKPLKRELKMERLISERAHFKWKRYLTEADQSDVINLMKITKELGGAAKEVTDAHDDQAQADDKSSTAAEDLKKAMEKAAEVEAKAAEIQVKMAQGSMGTATDQAEEEREKTARQKKDAEREASDREAAQEGAADREEDDLQQDMKKTVKEIFNRFRLWHNMGA